MEISLRITYLILITIYFSVAQYPLEEFVYPQYESDFENKLELYRESVSAWLEKLNAELDIVEHQSQELNWQRSTNISAETEAQVRNFQVIRSIWMSRHCSIARKIKTQLLDKRSRRMLKGFCEPNALSAEDSEKLIEVSNKLRDIYASTRVTLIDESYRGEPDLSGIMIRSHDYFKLLWAWSEWRRAIGPPTKDLYTEMVRLMNLAARNGGFRDVGEQWRAELETPNLEDVVDKLYSEVEPLYKELHAYVRGKLSEFYGNKLVNPTKPIPAHVLGNMWAQNWLGAYEIVKPSGSPDFAVTELLKSKNFTVMDMVKTAEDYFTSLGFEPLSEKFWKKSQFVKPTDGRETNCHGSAINLYDDDVRFMMCANVTEEDFITVHHEMGHLYYYLSYRHQPHLFKEGANSAFHEAVGDSIVYAVMGTLHRRFGATSESPSSEISFLLHQALLKVPLLPFSLVMEKWRWNVFNGKIPPSEYNTAWWKLRNYYQGIMPPIKRSEADFDPAAKYHIPDNTPYIRYFMSAILQVQFLDAMCEASKQGPRYNQQLYLCDIYGSKEAGHRLQSMLSLGSSEPWQTALGVITGGKTKHLSAKPLMDYYKPLYDWLKIENRKNNYTIGWPRA